MPFDGSRPLQPLVVGPGLQQDPAISRDGRWLAYTSDETGRNEVYVRPYPDVDAGRWQVSAKGGSLPVWSRSDDRLFFVDADEVLIAARYLDDDRFTVESVEAHVDLSGYTYADSQVDRNYDVDLTGERVFVSRPPSAELEMVTNFLVELERRLPTRD